LRLCTLGETKAWDLRCILILYTGFTFAFQ